MAIITLYVGNLPWETVPTELEQIFGEYGAVEAVRIIRDHESGRSRGFGFVVMAEEAALRAQARINGAKLRGRALVVSPAKERIEISEKELSAEAPHEAQADTSL
jgi:RNA recognition motif-containing protein